MFEIVKNGLYRDSFVKSMKLENDIYNITFFYEGDYATDIQSGRCDQDLLSMSCRIKDEAFTLMLCRDELLFTLPYEPVWGVKDILDVKKQLDIAQEAIVELRPIIKEYFGVEIK